MTDIKAVNLFKMEAGSSKPAGHSSSKSKSYNQRRNAKKKARNNVLTSIVKPKFTGRETELKDHIFTMGPNSCMMFS